MAQHATSALCPGALVSKLRHVLRKLGPRPGGRNGREWVRRPTGSLTTVFSMAFCPMETRAGVIKMVRIGQIEGMMSQWKNYQVQTAKFFIDLGLVATVEQSVEGVRGKHNVDVHVAGDYMGISFVWIVECKSWKSNVSKEKVAALSAIIQDIGADRGFLLSEKGFQSGALRMAEKSNITLTSLADLTSTVGDRHTTARVASLHLRIHNVTEKLRNLKKSRYDNEFYPPTMAPLGKVILLPMAIDDALRGDLPTPYTMHGPNQKFANSVEEMLDAADRLISEAEAWTPPE